ncbi:MAG: cobalt-precorrin-6A reductase [Bacillota bacterium]|nr:cobalt-precorrin-6A reductase [Bacillota bacterium]
MIGLILGTSEGKNILSELNKYTDDIFVSTATKYGGELLDNYSFRVMNTKPLDAEALKKVIVEHKIAILVDASHPYALVVTKNAMDVCGELDIEYVRYERPSIIENYHEENIIKVKDHNELHLKLKEINGNILNTTGSKEIEKILAFKLENRIIHRVLPTLEVVDKCVSLGIKPDDIIAIKGPIGYELNCSFIKEYNAKAIILKDSGIEGGTKEKLDAAVNLKIPAFVLEREKFQYKKVFNNEKELINYLMIHRR